MMTPSKIKFITNEILKEKLKRDFEKGGISSITISPPGEGKTNQLIHDIVSIFRYIPTEIVFWRDNPKSAVQFNKKGVKWEIFIEDGCNVSFRNLTDGGPIDIPYRTFKNFYEIINKDTGQGLAKPQQINVIYFKEEYSWIDFLEYLRHTVGWKSVFIDELEDLIPLNPPKREGETRNLRYEKNLFFAENFKELRKGWVNFFSNTQDLADIESRVRRKLNYIVYLAGARVEERGKVNQSSVNKLKRGLGFIEYEHGKFGKIRFDYYPNNTPYFEVNIV
jgi:hypothetical protein